MHHHRPSNKRPRRLRDHFTGALVAFGILILTMAVIVGPYTSTGHYINHTIHSWVAVFTPTDSPAALNVADNVDSASYSH